MLTVQTGLSTLTHKRDPQYGHFTPHFIQGQTLPTLRPGFTCYSMKLGLPLIQALHKEKMFKVIFPTLLRKIPYKYLI